MRYKKKFSDFIPESTLPGNWADSKEIVLDILWRRIRERYPNMEFDKWQNVYDSAKEDFEDNYEISVKVTIVRKEVKNEY